MSLSAMLGRPSAFVDDQKDWKILEEAIDWVTFTERTSQNSQDLYDRTKAIVTEEEKKGELRKRWAWQGYQGYCIPGIQYGYRIDGAIARFSGPMAEQYGRGIATDHPHVTRLDLQVTARRSTDRGNVAADTYEQTVERMKSKLRPKHHALTVSSDGGATFTVGRRVDEVYCRIYNKTVESGGKYPPNVWRWECELKARTAEVEMARQVASAPDEYVVSRSVYAWFLRCYVDPPWRDSPADRTWRAPREYSTAEKRMKYLGSVGRSIVESVAGWYSTEQILAALGLMAEDDSDIPWRQPPADGDQAQE